MRKHIMPFIRQTWVAAVDRGSHEPDQFDILPGASCGTEGYRSSAGEVLHRAIMGHIVHPASTAFLAFVLRVSGTRKSVHGSVSAHSPALCSANRAPIRSECFKNLSVQFWTHVDCCQHELALGR